jgi:hypothetical protein
MSAWLLFNAKWSIFQLYLCENKLRVNQMIVTIFQLYLCENKSQWYSWKIVTIIWLTRNLFSQRYSWKIVTIIWLTRNLFSQRYNFLAISLWEQVTCQSDDNDVCFVLDQHDELNFCIASSLNQQSMGRHVTPLGHIILSVILFHCIGGVMVSVFTSSAVYHELESK